MSPFLEHLILNGLANYDTWSVGGSGTGTLRVPKNTFIIMTDFDYFHFIDEPAVVVGVPAQESSAVQSDDFDLQWSLDGITFTPLVTFDHTDIPGTQALFQAAMTSILPGFVATLFYQPGFKQWIIQVVTTAPGAAYNGITPTIVTVPPTIPQFPAPFLFGTADFTPNAQDILDNATHQLEFRQKGKTFSFIVREDAQAFLGQTLVDEKIHNMVNVFGKYQKQGLYIPFTENIQIDICRVPRVSDWSISYTTLTNKSNEPKEPAGYGIPAAPPALNCVAEILFDGVSEQYLPVTEDRSDIALQQYREQFKVDYKLGRQLLNPQSENTDNGAKRTYPILNIGFVRVNLNWKAFQEQYHKYIKWMRGGVEPQDKK